MDILVRLSCSHLTVGNKQLHDLELGAEVTAMTWQRNEVQDRKGDHNFSKEGHDCPPPRR